MTVMLPAMPNGGVAPLTVTDVHRCWNNHGIRPDGRQHPFVVVTPHSRDNRLPCQCRHAAPLTLDRTVPRNWLYGVTRSVGIAGELVPVSMVS